ncbi:21900_t:CDS:2, partial [Racocetra persica]
IESNESRNRIKDVPIPNDLRRMTKRRNDVDGEGGAFERDVNVMMVKHKNKISDVDKRREKHEWKNKNLPDLEISDQTVMDQDAG